MKRLILPLSLVASLFAGVAFAQTSLSKEDKQKALDHLKQSENELTKTLKGLSEEQLQFKPDPESWSIQECVEHIAVSETNLFGIVEMSLETAPDPSKRESVAMSDEEILGFIQSREQKIKTSAELTPSNRFGSYESSLASFKEQRKRNMQFVKSTDQDLRNRYFEFPFGTVDLVQVVLFTSGHSVRHTAQIREIMAHEDFPGS